ncbi:MAG: DUF4363 family protein [Oscillospiraceae bacterium]|nr:DUF4363 family protein [Oscillospiraceae bacterium]
MKRLWISCIVLAALITATLLSSLYLQNLSQSVCDTLQQAQTYVQADNWDLAQERTAAAEQEWASHKGIYAALRHTDLNGVYEGFAQVNACLHAQESGEYIAANASLIARLEMLAQSDLLNLQNIL